MRNRVIAPLVMLATISTLTACSVTSKTTPSVTLTGSTGSIQIDTSGSTVIIIPTPETTGIVITPTGMPESTGSMHTGMYTPVTASGNMHGAPMTKTEIISYRSPAGEDKVEITVTVNDGIITAVSSKTLGTNDASKYNQNNFAKNVSVKVVGMAKKNFKIDTIGGASLTTGAFNQFIQSL